MVFIEWLNTGLIKVVKMDEKLRNFGMMIPAKSYDLFHKADPKGVPIYDKCKANGPCFCTGQCRKLPRPNWLQRVSARRPAGSSAPGPS